MKRKSVVTIIVVIIMIMLLQTSAFALTYTDVPTTHWAYIPIDRVTDLGFMSGVNGSFRRNRLLTREVAAEIFALLGGADLNSITQHPGFTDVTADSEYRAAIYWVKTNGIMSGTSSTQFSPYSVINRQEVCVALNKLKQVKNFQFETIASTPTFNDYNEISSWATTAVMNIASWGVISGDNYGNINPKQDIERQEMAAMVYAFWDLSRYKLNSTSTPVRAALQSEINTKKNLYNTATAQYRNDNKDSLDQKPLALAYATAASTCTDTCIAGRMLLHYLNNSGNPYEDFPLLNMVGESETSYQYKIYIDELNDMMKAVETLTTGRSNITLALRKERETEDGEINGFNWIYSIGKCRYSLQISATRSSNNVITADFTYILKDFYDFENEDKEIGGVTFKALNDMHLMGNARCYDVYGEIVFEDRHWNVGDRIYIE